MALVLGKLLAEAAGIEIYLNIAEWGDGTFGVEAAARRYFHKSASALDAREGALIATALPNPLQARSRPPVAAPPPSGRQKCARPGPRPDRQALKCLVTRAADRWQSLWRNSRRISYIFAKTRGSYYARFPHSRGRGRG